MVLLDTFQVLVVELGHVIVVALRPLGPPATCVHWPPEGRRAHIRLVGEVEMRWDSQSCTYASYVAEWYDLIQIFWLLRWSVISAIHVHHFSCRMLTYLRCGGGDDRLDEPWREEVLRAGTTCSVDPHSGSAKGAADERMQSWGSTGVGNKAPIGVDLEKKSGGWAMGKWRFFFSSHVATLIFKSLPLLGEFSLLP